PRRYRAADRRVPTLGGLDEATPRVTKPSRDRFGHHSFRIMHAGDRTHGQIRTYLAIDGRVLADAVAGQAPDRVPADLGRSAGDPHRLVRGTDVRCVRRSPEAERAGAHDVADVRGDVRVLFPRLLRDHLLQLGAGRLRVEADRWRATHARLRPGRRPPAASADPRLGTSDQHGWYPAAAARRKGRLHRAAAA